jgi:hypothetical protein
LKNLAPKMFQHSVIMAIYIILVKVIMVSFRNSMIDNVNDIIT